MYNLVFVSLYAIVTLAAVVVSIINSPLGEEPAAGFEPSEFSAIDIALLSGGTERAADVAIVDLLCRGLGRVVRPMRWSGQYSIELDEPQSFVLAPSVVLAKGRHRRARILTLFRADISARRAILVEHGFFRRPWNMARTIAWTSYPVAASTSLGVFLLSLFQDGSWPHSAVTIFLICGLVALVAVNADVRRTPLGKAAHEAVRLLYAHHLAPSPTYAVALWGPEQLRSTPFEAYANMVRADTTD